MASVRLIARFSDQSSSQARSDALSGLSEEVIRSYPSVSGLVVLEPTVATAFTTPGGQPSKRSASALKERMQALMATGLFRYVEPDYEVKALLAPTDARFVDGTLWGLRNTGQAGGVVGADIDAERAWDITPGSTSVIVAVVDSGVRYTHQDLAAQMWVNPGETPGNGVDDDADGYVDNVHGINAITGSGDPLDDNDHGTHVAGTIGAAANDGNPHVGVAWNVRLMACKFLDANGSGSTSDAIECINFAVTEGARVLNNSWGGGGSSQGVYDAIVNARNQGVLFVAAAGNEANNNDSNPRYPSSYSLDNIIAVAALDRTDRLAGFSNYGRNSVHLGAPGVSIFSCISGSDSAYGVLDGTSMAAPHVSGVAALVLAQQPGVSLSELRERIVQNVVPVAALEGVTITGGRLNAYNALTIGQDNVLEIQLTSSQGTLVAAGTTIQAFAKVTDLIDVTNATVTGSIPGQSDTPFPNNGVAPDETADDAVYSANIQVPASGGSFTLTMVALAPGKSASTNTFDFTIIQPPVNDAFADAVVVDGAGGSLIGENRNATAESQEPIHCGAEGGRSVWWIWTAPENQVTTISTVGSDFDTVLAVHTGSSVGGLSLTACNDDVMWGSLASEVIFEAIAGTTYRIAVDGYFGEEGNISLSLLGTPPLTNDDFTDRTPISGVNHTIRSSNFGATVEGLEPYHCDNYGGASVWWSWTAPEHMPVTISTAGSSFDTILAIYIGSTLGSLAEVACNDDRITPVRQSEVSFNAVGGTTYQVAVEGFGDGFAVDVGNIVLSLLTSPPNDQFANRVPLTGSFAETTGYNIAATDESGEPYHCSVGGFQSVWWTWTAPRSGNVSVSTADSSFDTALAVYTGESVTALTTVACNDDEAYPALATSKASFPAQGGTTYHIAVEGFAYYDDFGFYEGTDAGLISLALSLDGASRLEDLKERQDGYYQFILKGDSGRDYAIEASSDAVAWSPIGALILRGASTIFVDPAPPENSVRLYRAFPAPLIE
jgi:subtilisin family serine protease